MITCSGTRLPSPVQDLEVAQGCYQRLGFPSRTRQGGGYGFATPEPRRDQLRCEDRRVRLMPRRSESVGELTISKGQISPPTAESGGTSADSHYRRRERGEDHPGALCAIAECGFGLRVEAESP
jgi:hypothetical protein